MFPVIERKEKHIKISQRVDVSIEPNMVGNFQYDVVFDFSSSDLKISVISNVKKPRTTNLPSEDVIHLKNKYNLDLVNTPEKVFIECTEEILKTKVKL